MTNGSATDRRRQPRRTIALLTIADGEPRAKPRAELIALTWWATVPL